MSPSYNKYGQGFLMNKKAAMYKKTRMEIELRFIGLSHGASSLVKSLISMADLETGLVDKITYRDLATILTVNSAPGRKDSGIPSKQTIRSYLRTIEAQCGDHFKVISEDRSLKIQFPTLPKIYETHFGSTEVYTHQGTDLYTSQLIVNNEKNSENNEEKITDKYTHSYTDEYTAPINARVKIKPKNKTNKQQTNASESFVDLRKPISPDFFPSAEIIEIATQKGLIKVTSELEIRRFINYNLCQGTRWADYNYVFLNWLERDIAPDSAQISSTARKNTHERYSTASRSFKSIIEDVRCANGDAVAPWECIERTSTCDDNGTGHFMVVDTTNRAVWADVHY